MDPADLVAGEVGRLRGRHERSRRRQKKDYCSGDKRRRSVCTRQARPDCAEGAWRCVSHVGTTLTLTNVREVEGMFEHAEVTNGFAKVSCLLATLLSGLVHPPVG